MRPVCVLLIFVSLLFAASCQHDNHHEHNHGNVSTTVRLKEWGLLVIEAVESEDGDFFFFGTFDKILEKLKPQGYHIEGMIREFREDVWQQPFIKETKLADGANHLRILSIGANGIHEGGAGDDLYLDLIWDGKKSVTGKVSFPSTNRKRDFIIVPREK